MGNSGGGGGGGGGGGPTPINDTSAAVAEQAAKTALQAASTTSAANLAASDGTAPVASDMPNPRKTKAAPAAAGSKMAAMKPAGGKLTSSAVVTG